MCWKFVEYFTLRILSKSAKKEWSSSGTYATVENKTRQNLPESADKASLPVHWRMLSCLPMTGWNGTRGSGMWSRGLHFRILSFWKAKIRTLWNRNFMINVLTAVWFACLRNRKDCLRSSLGKEAYVTVKRTYPTGADPCYSRAVAGEGRSDPEDWQA